MRSSHPLSPYMQRRTISIFDNYNSLLETSNVLRVCGYL